MEVPRDYLNLDPPYLPTPESRPQYAPTAAVQPPPEPRASPDLELIICRHCHHLPQITPMHPICWRLIIRVVMPRDGALANELADIEIITECGFRLSRRP